MVSAPEPSILCLVDERRSTRSLWASMSGFRRTGADKYFRTEVAVWGSGHR